MGLSSLARRIFPEKVSQKRELEYAASIFPTIEINCSFYSLERPFSYQSWANRTPQDFMFSVKGPRYITPCSVCETLEHPLLTSLRPAF